MSFTKILGFAGTLVAGAIATYIKNNPEEASKIVKTGLGMTGEFLTKTGATLSNIDETQIMKVGKIAQNMSPILGKLK